MRPPAPNKFLLSYNSKVADTGMWTATSLSKGSILTKNKGVKNCDLRFSI